MPKYYYNFKSGGVLTMIGDKKGESSGMKSQHVLSIKVELKPFTGKENFTLWQRRMKHVLKQQDFSKVLAGKEKKSVTMTSLLEDPLNNI